MGSSPEPDLENAAAAEPEFKIIDPQRLERESWKARNGMLSPSQDDFSDDDRNDAHPIRGTTSQLSWYQNTVYDDVEKSRLRAPVPSVFLRPTRHRSIGKSDSSIRLQRSLASNLSEVLPGDGIDVSCSPSWVPEIRHTVKSHLMSNYLKVRTCVINQIDFIKQRDNVWPDRKIYAALVLLRKFMGEHNFRYFNIPDHQRQWLQDMLKRLDQWYILHRPRKIAHLNRWREKMRRLEIQESLKKRCLRQINPPYYDFLTKELSRVDRMIVEERRNKRRRLQELNQTRMDWIEGRLTRWHPKIRPDRKERPPEMVPLHISRQPYYEKEVLKTWKPAQRINVPHKPLIEIAQGLAVAKRMANSVGGRDPSLPKHLDPSSQRTRAARPRPVKSTEVARSKSPQKLGLTRSQSALPPEDGKSNKAPSKELAEILDLIQSVEAQQKKLKSELTDLKRKKGAITGVPEPKERSHPTDDGTGRVGCRPVNLAPLPAKAEMRKHHEEAHRTAAARHEFAGQERSETIRKKREKHHAPLPPDAVEKKPRRDKHKRRDRKAKKLLRQVYRGVHEAIDQYVDQLVRKEFLKDAESDIDTSV